MLDIQINRIKFYCEEDETFLCSQCKKEHKGREHSIKDYKVDAKKFRIEVNSMLDKYHLNVEKLLNTKLLIKDRIKNTDGTLNEEIDKINQSYISCVDRLKESKTQLIEEVRKKI